MTGTEPIIEKPHSISSILVNFSEKEGSNPIIFIKIFLKRYR